MKLNTIYNCIVLLYLHAFCLLICYQIEDHFLVELHMNFGVFLYNSYWYLFLRMLFLSPFIGYYFFKKQEDTEYNSFDKTFGIIFSLMLLGVVLTQLLGCGNGILSFELPLVPGLLCCGVNFLALGLYYLWIYSQKKFVNTNNVKIFRIGNICFVLLSLTYGFTVTNYYTPYKLLEAHHHDKILMQFIERIQNQNKVFNNIDEFIHELSNTKEINQVKALVQSKHLMYQKIDNNKYKISWKTHLTTYEFNRITRFSKRWHNLYPMLYNQDNKIINVKDGKLGDKEMPEEVRKIVQEFEKPGYSIKYNLDGVTSNSSNVKSNNNIRQEEKNDNNTANNDNTDSNNKLNSEIKQENVIDKTHNNENNTNLNDKTNSEIKQENNSKKSN